MIETYLLEQLVAVRKHDTLISAAESMNISQPAISKSMKKLEELMDIPLFTELFIPWTLRGVSGRTGK